MNANNAKDYLPLVQALAEGKTIQVSGVDEWVDVEGVCFTRSPDCYRIKPEPREWGYNRYPDGRDCGGYSSKESAQMHADVGAIQVRYREVIE